MIPGSQAGAHGGTQSHWRSALTGLAKAQLSIAPGPPAKNGHHPQGWALPHRS